MSHKTTLDKERGTTLLFVKGTGLTVTSWPWTARQRRQKLGNRLARKQARKEKT